MELKPNQTKKIGLEEYRIVRELGEGGSARVYEARDKHNEPVCIKSGIFAGTPFTSIFENEAKKLMELNHPNIPKIRRLCLEKASPHQYAEEMPYLVMELKKGKTLHEKLNERKAPLEEEEAKDIAYQILEITKYLHTQPTPVCHLDIKPKNIIISEQGEASLIDFGNSRKITDNLLLDDFTDVSGTPGYIPAENWQTIFTPQTDIFQIGATTAVSLSQTGYNILMRNRPWTMRELEAMKKRNGLHPEAEKMLKASEKTIELIIDMTQQDLERRVKTAEEAQARLKAA